MFDIYGVISLIIMWVGLMMSGIALWIMQIKIYNVLLQIRDTRIEIKLVKEEDKS
jgi:hypothetical protein